MEYLTNILGIHVVYKDDKPKSMPNFLRARYQFQKVTLDGKEAIFLYPKTEMDTVNTVKKHIERIKGTECVPVILKLTKLTYRQREYLLREHIPFIVEGKQIYLPFMAVYLQERCDGERLTMETMLPSAQVLLLYYIYHGCGELLTSEAALKLDFTPTSISRASRQLEEMGLIHTKKRGVQKIISSEKTPEALFYSASGYFRNPVKRTIYVPKSEIHEKPLISGYQALSEYSMLNPPLVLSFATDSIAMWEKNSSGNLQNSEEQYAVELWRYDPKKLADGECMDRLSLAITFRNDGDERVEEAVNDMLTQVWRNINGKRN